MADPIIIRSARLADVDRMTDVFFESFNQKFWTHICPDNSPNRSFIVDMWTKGMHASTDRTFVAVDTADSDRIIGVSRWQVPLYDQSTGCDSWPEPSMLDQDIAVSLFRAEDLGRRTIMGDRPHWYLDIIGVDESYQGRGVGKKLMEWGIKNADENKVEIFLHGTEMTQNFYQQVKQYGFKIVGEIQVPDHPTYGTYQHASMVRAPSNCRVIHSGKL